MNAVMGEGKYRFQLVPGWAKVPEGWTLGQTGIATDSRGRVYLYNRSPHPMMVFERDGTFIESWGEDVFTTAHHLSIDRNERLYLPVWASHVIAKCDLDGRQLMTLGTWNEPSNPHYRENPLKKVRDHVTESRGPFTLPTDVAFAPDGDIFVADGYGNARIHRFSPNGELKASWGQPGSGPGEFRIPHSLRFMSDGRLIVADRENDRLQIFDVDGKFLEEWTGFSSPGHLYIDADDVVFVAEGTGFHKGSIPDPFLQVRDSRGKLISKWDSPRGAGGHCVWMDDHGDLYVGQNLEGQRILKYQRC